MEQLEQDSLFLFESRQKFPIKNVTHTTYSESRPRVKKKKLIYQKLAIYDEDKNT